MNEIPTTLIHIYTWRNYYRFSYCTKLLIWKIICEFPNFNIFHSERLLSRSLLNLFVNLRQRLEISLGLRNVVVINTDKNWGGKPLKIIRMNQLKDTPWNRLASFLMSLSTTLKDAYRDSLCTYLSIWDNT